MTNKLIVKSFVNSRAIFLFPLLLILLLSSCGMVKNVGIEKRLYRPGYNISTNSANTLPVKNIVASTVRKNSSDTEAAFAERQEMEITTNMERDSYSVVNNHLNKVKAIFPEKKKKVTNAVRKMGLFPIHKAEPVLKPEKVNSGRIITVPAEEGKSYSLSTVMFVVGAICIIWGLAVLFSGISMMSTSIAMALTIILGLVLVIAWGLLILMIKEWFNGTSN